MLFLQLPPVHSPSTARPPDPDLRSRSSISSLLPCYFCSSRPSTARPPPVHRILYLRSRSSISSLLPCYFCTCSPSTGRPPPVHRILTFDLALFLQLPPVHSSSTARPPDPDLRSRSSISSLLPCYFCTSSPSTARPPPVHRILTFDLAPPSLASSHAISAPAARPQAVHRPSTGSWPSISLYFCSSRPSTARPPPVHRILTFDLAPPSLASSHAISAPPARPQPVHRPSTGSWPSISLLHL